MIQNKKVIAVTLARGGSKRIPNKNIVDICGKPLIQYTIDEVKKSKYIDTYIISSDSDKILSLAQSLNCITYKRDNVSDKQTSSDGLIDTIINKCGINVSDKQTSFIVVEIMATNPLKTVEDIDGTIEKFFDGDSAVSVVRILDNHPSRVKMIKNGYLENFWPEVPESRRQDLTPEAYVRNGSIYVMWWRNLVSTRRRLGKKIAPYIMSEERTINIDEPIDLELARILIEKKQNK